MNMYVLVYLSITNKNMIFTIETKL